MKKRCFVMSLMVCNLVMGASFVEIDCDGGTRFEYTIRNGCEDDKQQIEGLITKIKTGHTGFSEELGYCRQGISIASLVSNALNKGGAVVVAEQGGDLIGVMLKIVLLPLCTHVLSDGAVVVYPEYKKSLILKNMLNHFCENVKTKRADIIRMETFVRASSVFVDLYKKCGFKEECRLEKRLKTRDNKDFEDEVVLVWKNTSFPHETKKTLTTIV